MKISFAVDNSNPKKPVDILQIDEARICYRNFRGEAGKFNKEGERNFSLVIPDEEVANDLIERGWRVKIRAPREEGDTPFMHLPVKVNFNSRGPKVYLKSGKRTLELDESTVNMLDSVDITSVDLDIRSYDWENSFGETGRKAYLMNIWVTQRVDQNRFASRLENDEDEFEDE